MEIQALPLQRYSPRLEALNQNCAFSCLVQGGREPRVTFVSVSGHGKEEGGRLLGHTMEEQRGSSPCPQRAGHPGPILTMSSRERGKRHPSPELGSHRLRKPWGLATMGLWA